jgi:hypothetical protein
MTCHASGRAMGRNAQVLSLIAVMLMATRAHAGDAWAASYDPRTRTRFIPVELWTGARWDGQRKLRLAPADLVFGDREDKRIVGPVAWRRPGTRQVVQVYERRTGDKKQLFALSSRGDGLGRVFDSRYGRDCVDEVKFPLGTWRQGERREFRMSCNGGRLRRTVVLTIEEIDFVWAGVSHSLRFHWVVDGGNRPGTDMRYTYSPGRGLVSQDGEE